MKAYTQISGNVYSVEIMSTLEDSYNDKLCECLLGFLFACLDPAVPTNLRISEITCTAAIVFWDVVNGATGLG